MYEDVSLIEVTSHIQEVLYSYLELLWFHRQLQTNKWSVIVTHSCARLCGKG